VGKFCEWLNVDERALFFVLNQHRNSKVWKQLGPNEWDRDFTEDIVQTSKNSSEHDKSLGFHAHTALHMEKPDSYITVGKGFPL
jgi:hypothetical protein